VIWRRDRPWRAYFGVIALSLGAHIAGDWITSYGTMVLSPVSDIRVGIGTTFIIDLFFTGIILAGLAASAAWRKSNVPAITALGALCAGVPVAIAKSQGWDLVDAERSGFVVYAVVAVLVAVIYRGLPKPPPRPRMRTAPLAKSRGIVLRLTALFSIDSFAGGFVVQSLLVLWLFKRFDLSVETAGAIFFVAGLLAAFSQLASAWLSARIGLIRTMVYTHLPSNACLIVAALMPSAPLAVAFLLLRTSMSQMDVPARQSYVMAVVPPEERAAAASVTNVPRALASSLSPAISGVLLATTTFGWPLILCGVLKIIYDLLLLAQFQSRRPEEELAPRAATT